MDPAQSKRAHTPSDSSAAAAAASGAASSSVFSSENVREQGGVGTEEEGEEGSDDNDVDDEEEEEGDGDELEGLDMGDGVVAQEDQSHVEGDVAPNEAMLTTLSSMMHSAERALDDARLAQLRHTSDYMAF